MVSIYNEAIREGLKKGEPIEQISRKLYLSYPTKVFIDNEEVEFQILNTISNFFNVPFPSVQVVGSAKTGFSYVNKREFLIQESDLDIAVISSKLFRNCLDYVYQITDGYTNLTNFDRPDDIQKFYFNLKLGFINPYNLPIGNFRSDWIGFFNNLSTHYYDYFKKISGGIYATQYLFEMKQYRAINNYLHSEGGD